MVCAAMALLFFVISPRNKRGSMYMYLGFLCTLAIIFGVILGLYDHYEFMMTYWSYNEYRVYTDVLPSEPAAAHADAGTMVHGRLARGYNQSSGLQGWYCLLCGPNS